MSANHVFSGNPATLVRWAAVQELLTRIKGRLRLGLVSRKTRIGLRRDLALPFLASEAKIPISVRRATDYDLHRLLPADTRDMAEADRLEVAWRRAFIARGAPLDRCFVAVDTRTDAPCFMQWLLHSEHNSFIASIGGFPSLNEDEALLENAYTPPSARGLGIMPAAMARIAGLATNGGARFVTTFVDQHNAPSLKGCNRAGFAPQLQHRRTLIAFGLVQRDSFGPLT